MNNAARIATAAKTPGRRRERALNLLSTSVSGASLAVLRIVVGLVMILESISIFLPSESSGGLSHLDVYYTGKGITFNFPYEGFGWLPLLPAPWFQGLCGRSFDRRPSTFNAPRTPQCLCAPGCPSCTRNENDLSATGSAIALSSRIR